jgi:H+/gluconate symporter-like permease
MVVHGAVMAYSSRIVRPLVIPVAAVIGAIATPVLLLPRSDKLLRAGEFVDGTPYGLTPFLGLILGALVGYIVRTALDMSLWWTPKDDDKDAAA